MTISELSRLLHLSRKTVRERLKDGWSIEEIKRFYKNKGRIAKKEVHKRNVLEIESLTGENFETTIKKIMTWTNDKQEIAQSLGLQVEDLETYIRERVPSVILKLR